MAIEKKRLDGRPEELSILWEISQILDSSLDLRTVVEPVMEVITRSMGMKFTTLTLLNRQSGEISIEAAYGLSATQKRRGRYKLGEGITGKVIQTGKTAIVPRISAEPEFLDKTGARKSQEDGRTLLPLRPDQAGTRGGRRDERRQARLGSRHPPGGREVPLHHRLPHRTGGAAAPVGAGGEGAAPGGEPPPAG